MTRVRLIAVPINPTTYNSSHQITNTRERHVPRHNSLKALIEEVNKMLHDIAMYSLRMEKKMIKGDIDHGDILIVNYFLGVSGGSTKKCFF